MRVVSQPTQRGLPNNEFQWHLKVVTQIHICKFFCDIPKLFQSDLVCRKEKQMYCI